MPKNSFIKSNWRSGVTDRLLEAGARITGGVAASFIANKVGGNTNVSQTFKNVVNPGILILSTVGDIMLENDKLRAMCQGMQVVSFAKTLKVMAPEVYNTLGLGGIENEAALMATVQPAQTALPAGSPEEFANVKPITDGNPWSEVAEEIEKDNDSNVKVEQMGNPAALF